MRCSSQVGNEDVGRFVKAKHVASVRDASVEVAETIGVVVLSRKPSSLEAHMSVATSR